MYQLENSSPSLLLSSLPALNSALLSQGRAVTHLGQKFNTGERGVGFLELFFMGGGSIRVRLRYVYSPINIILGASFNPATLRSSVRLDGYTSIPSDCPRALSPNRFEGWVLGCGRVGPHLFADPVVRRGVPIAMAANSTSEIQSCPQDD